MSNMEPGTGDWLFDLGNSRLKLAPLLAGGRVGEVEARSHDQPDWMEALPAGQAAWVCDVASGALSRQLRDALSQRFERVVIARSSALFGGVRVAYPHPERLGVDRLLAMRGALATGAGPWLVVGVGTALTIDLLAADGRHMGGRIAPSPDLMRVSLRARVSRLPASGGCYAEFADDTADALASGCEGAAIALVERSLAQAGVLLGEEPALLLHGGGAGALASHLVAATVSPALVMQGLAAWANAGERPA